MNGATYEKEKFFARVTNRHAQWANGRQVGSRHVKFRFSCNIHWPHHDPDQAFEVVWTFDNHTYANIPAVTVKEPARVAYLQGSDLKGHLGTNVGCKIRSFYQANSNMTSAWLESNTYWAGIRADPKHVDISEKQGEKNVTLTSTIPIVCEHIVTCCIDVKLDVDGDKS
nr:hypothetical protein BaRGS_019757 [Batillaria attramentaria]